MTPLESLVAGMTIEQLARLANTTVEQVVTKALAGKNGAPAPRHAKTESTSPSPPSSTGVPAGRGKAARNGKPGARAKGSISDAEVLAIVGAVSEPVSSEFVRAKLGGSAAQIRAALHRLRDSKRIRVSGKKRGTRYAVR